MRKLAVAACLAAQMFLGAGIASASYRQPAPTVEVNPSQVTPGSTVTATLRTTCVDGNTISFHIDPGGDNSVAICAVDVYAARLTAPSRPGTYNVVASGEDVNNAQPATLTVVTTLGGTEQPLPSTGPQDPAWIALIGGAVLAAGLALLGLARFRPVRR